MPIPSSTNTPGTAITLPYLPNSMISDSAGAKLYLGSSTALMIVDTATGTVTSASIAGTVVAISADGNYLLISNGYQRTPFPLQHHCSRNPLVTNRHLDFGNLYAG